MRIQRRAKILACVAIALGVRLHMEPWDSTPKIRSSIFSVEYEFLDPFDFEPEPEPVRAVTIFNLRELQPFHSQQSILGVVNGIAQKFRQSKATQYALWAGIVWKLATEFKGWYLELG